MTFDGIILKMRNVTIILLQSLSPILMVLILKKDLGLFLSIISSKVLFKVLK